LAESLRRRRRGKAGRSWYVDETYIKVHGPWRYLYRAIDRSGALVDVMFSEHRDMAAAKVPLPSPHCNGFECVGSRLRNPALHQTSYTCWHER
jgi:hypothetical protein